MDPVLLGLIPSSFMVPGLRVSNLDLVAPSLGYVTLYSFLAHKETRFLFPIVPPVTAAIARTVDYIYNRSSRSLVYRLFTLFFILSTAATALISHGLLLPLSAQTYPGAHALSSLHGISLAYRPQPTVRVHLTNLALQTGVTNFLSTPSSASKFNTSITGHDRPINYLPGGADGSRLALSSKTRTQWIYDKSDNQTEFLTPTFWAQFDYVVVEDPGRVIGRWDVVDKIPGLGRPSVSRPDVGRGLVVLGDKAERREDDGVSRLVEAMYGRWMMVAYGILHDVLREGYGLEKVLGRRVSLTLGWWVHWELETKLFIMKKAEGPMVVWDSNGEQLPTPPSW